MQQLLSVEADSIIPEVELAPFKPNASKLGADPIKDLT